MTDMTLQSIELYLQEALGGPVRLLSVGDIGTLDEQGIKDFGYGKPLKIQYERYGQTHEAVISAMRGDRYGHQDWWDRARVIMFQHDTSARLPNHVRPIGMGFVDAAGRMRPMKGPQELFIVNEKLEGHDYFLDLDRIRKEGATEADIELVRSLAQWLAQIHSTKHDEPDRYIRRIRNLVGDCECIFGIADGYPHPYDEFPQERFIRLEKRLVEWRWKLRDYTHRLAEVHGDFHPWNILVSDKGEQLGFSVLDRSRGVWGEPGDDVATLALNYALFAMLDGTPSLQGPMQDMYTEFWETYMQAAQDDEMAEVLAPFFVFRGLVIASPEWYPGHAPQVRRALFRFIENVLEAERFDWRDFNSYLE